ncbi:hypothetical protein [Herbiconiux daphne]|uniref:Uncharacterized protein n=1 Tax=Herbiconiux daphne TaxID=2970914 RepID=A0ABT2H392_9MICO|nr:hypothetical protein [Herbiconiux daphne]MCS5734366.1 hypothetical protein [Herbiconiux daphne]
MNVSPVGVRMNVVRTLPEAKGRMFRSIRRARYVLVSEQTVNSVPDRSRGISQSGFDQAIRGDAVRSVLIQPRKLLYRNNQSAARA